MSAGGSVIINGSAGWVKGIRGNTVYAPSKAALRSFARTWTAELAGRGHAPGQHDVTGPDDWQRLAAVHRLGQS